MSDTYERRAQIARLSLAHCGIEPTSDRIAALAEDASRIADAFPPLTAEQHARLAVLLRPVPQWGGAA